MELQRFFDHWKLKEHPFQAEEALSDSVYNRMLEAAISHPDFTKIYGDPGSPSTSIVFGEKGSGKTAIRLMMQRKLSDYNRSRETGRVWVVCYDELNPVLDRLSRHLNTQDGEKTLSSIRLADHQDAIMSLAVTDLLNQVLEPQDKSASKPLIKAMKRMHPQKRNDLAILALLYDQPKHGQTAERWKQLCRILRISSTWKQFGSGFLFAVAAATGLAGAAVWVMQSTPGWEWVTATLVGLSVAALQGLSWLSGDWRSSRIEKQVNNEIRVVNREKGVVASQVRELNQAEMLTQLLPAKGDQDSRFDLTGRFLRIIHEIGYSSLIALVDRVDEPVLVNGDVARMKMLVWPMLNNKFLQQEHIGIKMLLPIELGHLLAAEDTEFKRQARLDKQNLINPLKWTGTTLYDLCSWRFRNCRKAGEQDDPVALEALFDDDVTSASLSEALDQMHQPRDAFKFLYAVVLEHCRNTPAGSDDFQISQFTLDYVRREQSQRVVDLYRGVASS